MAIRKLAACAAAGLLLGSVLPDGLAVTDSVIPREKLPVFKSLDMNGDGSISRSEMANRPALAKYFDQADRDRDGKLNRSEYRQLGRLIDARKDR